MKIKGLNECDTVNYKKTSMFIAFPECSFKCCKEAGCDICQNSQLSKEPDIEITVDELLDRYITNNMSHAVVCGGLEPCDSKLDLIALVSHFRKYTDDDIVIYTGYNENEIADLIEELKQYENIIVKFGRFIPNQEPHYDKTLGVQLSSPNQKARRIS